MQEVINWIESVKKIEMKIFHPDFSPSILSNINVGLGVFLLLLLVIRRYWPFITGRDSLYSLTHHFHGLHLWTAFIMWFFTVLEGGLALDTGLNFILCLLNTALIQSADNAATKHTKETIYRELMNEAIILYGINEAHCRDVVSDHRILRSILTMVDTNLTFNNINAADERHTQGNKLFDDLLGRERLHNQLISSPTMNDTLIQWLKLQ